MKIPEISLKSFYEAVAESSSEELWHRDSVQGLAQELREACEEVGFFVLNDHGIGESLIESYRKECAAFFKRPPQSNVLAMVSCSDSRFVWLDHVPSEDKSAWSLGPVQGRGSMPWQLDGKDFIRVWTDYYAAVEQLVSHLMSLFAVAMNLPVTAFDAALDKHGSSMRAILYPKLTQADFESGHVVRSPEHTDWGCVTVLLADPDVSGLEVCDKDGQWTPLQPVKRNSLVVNLGELLQWWTGGQWLATPHRVLARPENAGERLSCPYFGLVNREVILRPLLSDNGAEGESSITAGEFFQNHEKYTSRACRHAADSRTEVLEKR